MNSSAPRDESEPTLPDDRPKSIAIAGAWGYIGRHFLDAAIALGLDVRVYDPGPPPNDVPTDGYTRIDQEEDFYRQKVDLFHLALHPEHRRRGIEILLDRAKTEPIFILNEKPMATPESPETCRQIVEQLDRSSAVMLYDFPELFDGMTARIVKALCQFQQVTLTHLAVCRSKDREDPANPRNTKRMVPIQFQESVHCVAFVLYLLETIAGARNLLERPITVRAESARYRPPNPEVYPYVVDGRCDYTITIGDVEIEGTTNFTSGAKWSKRRTVQGIGDGRDFEIDVDYLEGKKRLSIDGTDQACDPAANSYEQAIVTAWQWCRAKADSRSTTACPTVVPDARFAHRTYQLSSALWRSSQAGEQVHFDSFEELEAFDARFADAVEKFPRYTDSAGR